MIAKRVVLVTGASSGIGRSVSVALAHAGYAVAALGRRADALTDLATQVPIAFGRSCDVGDPAALEEYFHAMINALGRLDIVFNNAGITSPAAEIGDVELQDWHGVMQTNLFGSFYVARCAFRQMRAQSPQGGRIINNGSIFGSRPSIALRRIHRQQARDHRPDQVNCVGWQAVLDRL